MLDNEIELALKELTENELNVEVVEGSDLLGGGKKRR